MSEHSGRGGPWPASLALRVEEAVAAQKGLPWASAERFAAP